MQTLPPDADAPQDTWDTMGYCQQEGGTLPTGMHTCWSYGQELFHNKCNPFHWKHDIDRQKHNIDHQNVISATENATSAQKCSIRHGF